MKFTWTKWLVFACITAASAIYLDVGLGAVICNTIEPRALFSCPFHPSESWLKLNLADRGQYLSGIFTPLALIWFIVGIWLQQQELELVRLENKSLAKANDYQAEALIAAGRTADREMVLTLFDRADKETATNLIHVRPVIDELRELSRIYPSSPVAEETRDAQDLISSRILQICVILGIFYNNPDWVEDVIHFYDDSSRSRARFISCTISLAFFLHAITERYDYVRELAKKAQFLEVFETRFDNSEERILYEECKRWLNAADTSVQNARNFVHEPDFEST